jgi:hypothetical protein
MFRLTRGAGAVPVCILAIVLGLVGCDNKPDKKEAAKAAEAEKPKEPIIKKIDFHEMGLALPPTRSSKLGVDGITNGKALDAIRSDYEKAGYKVTITDGPDVTAELVHQGQPYVLNGGSVTKHIKADITNTFHDPVDYHQVIGGATIDADVFLNSFVMRGTVSTVYDAGHGRYGTYGQAYIEKTLIPTFGTSGNVTRDDKGRAIVSYCLSRQGLADSSCAQITVKVVLTPCEHYRIMTCRIELAYTDKGVETLAGKEYSAALLTKAVALFGQPDPVK